MSKGMNQDYGKQTQYVWKIASMQKLMRKRGNIGISVQVSKGMKQDYWSDKSNSESAKIIKGTEKETGYMWEMAKI